MNSLSCLLFSNIPGQPLMVFGLSGAADILLVPVRKRGCCGLCLVNSHLRGLKESRVRAFPLPQAAGSWGTHRHAVHVAMRGRTLKQQLGRLQALIHNFAPGVNGHAAEVVARDGGKVWCNACVVAMRLQAKKGDSRLRCVRGSAREPCVCRPRGYMPRIALSG